MIVTRSSTPSIFEKTTEMDKRTIITTQIIMTFLMAMSMSGIMSLIALGPTALWLSVWPKQFIIAWPIAFVLTNIAFRIATPLARKIMPPRMA